MNIYDNIMAVFIYDNVMNVGRDKAAKKFYMILAVTLVIIFLFFFLY